MGEEVKNQDAYGCPKCGATLKMWQSYGFRKEVKINPKTGEPYKTVTKTRIERSESQRGLRCEDERCGWQHLWEVDSLEPAHEHLINIPTLGRRIHL